MVNGYTAIAVTKLDILDDFDEIKIGVKYVKTIESKKKIFYSQWLEFQKLYDLESHGFLFRWNKGDCSFP